MKELSISLLSLENKDKRDEFIRDVKEKNVRIHFDITDGKFVIPKGVELEIIKTAKECNLYADVHLMVAHPLNDNYIDKSIEYGANCITIHYEIDNFEENLNYLINKKEEAQKLGKELLIGVAIKLETDVSVLDKYLNLIDKVIIMSVEVGYGGRPYDISANEKIRYLKERYKNLIIQIDGGVNEDIIKQDEMKYVNEFVVGSAITKHKDCFDRVDYFLKNI